MILKLAWRSIWRNKRRTLITVGSIGLGLSVAIFFIAFAEGIYVQLINDGVRMKAGHITLENPAYREAPAVDLFFTGSKELRNKISKMDGVAQTKLLVLGQGMAKTGLGASNVAIVGVEPGREIAASPLVKRIIDGRYLTDADKTKVVLGEVLAKRLHLKVGKKLVLSTNDINGALTEELCRVAGIFRTGVEEVDGYLIQAPIAFTQKLYGLPKDGVTQLGVVLHKSSAMKRTKKAIEKIITNQSVSVRLWPEVMPELASYIKLDKGSNLILQAILIFLILFTILNTILMSVMERQKEFAVLKALGTEPYLLRGQLLLESAMIGLIGCAAGLLVGGSVTYALEIYGFNISGLLEEGMSISGFAVSPIIHPKLTFGLLAVLSGIVVLATLIISLLPMRQAIRTPIAETLR